MGLPKAKRPAAIAVIRKGLERFRNNPDIDWERVDRVPGNPELSVALRRHCSMEEGRAEKAAWRAAEEEENRLARDESRKRLDGMPRPSLHLPPAIRIISALSGRNE